MKSETLHSHSLVAHQFEDLDQQRDASTLGMWTFLVTEVMFFGGMFLVYTVYRNNYHTAFAGASHSLDVILGAVNTAVLIGSSLSMALAVHAAQVGKKKALVGFLLLTIMLGLIFLGVKSVEYTDKFVEHHVPGPYFHYEGPDALHAQLFFSLYFALTGMHALHMIIGIGVMSVLVVLAAKGRFTPETYSPVELTGLYWHFVDIVWIFLFPLLYLIGRHQ